MILRSIDIRFGYGLVDTEGRLVQQNCFRSLKETKRPTFGPFWGTHKMGSFYPFSGGV